jgi:peptidoglycan hydrolase CwlO-like protein
MISRHPPRRRPARRAAALCLVAAAVVLGPAPAGAVSPEALQQRITADSGHEQALRAAIARDSNRAASFNGRLGDLQARLNAIQTTLDFESIQLAATQGRLRGARARLTGLRLRFAADEDILRAQLVASYETPPPDVASVIVDAHGFSDLLERMDYLRLISSHNAQVTAQVEDARTAVATEAAQLAQLEARQSQTTRAVLLQRDEAARLRLSVLDQQLVYARARAAKASELAPLHAQRVSLESQLASIQASVNAAPVLSGPGALAPFSGASGLYGFFQAPGTNYSVGDTPALAARLNTLGKALQLHLIGISGYRTPQHSVEVGGFANDPHTRGQASDTPGVEGVPEATLEQYGLTRPFPGPAEADHIQLH